MWHSKGQVTLFRNTHLRGAKKEKGVVDLHDNALKTLFC